MRLFALATMLFLGAIIGVSPTGAYPPGNRPPRVSNANIAITLTFNSEIGKVRTLSPPENFDDKGKVKKYTRAELLNLKGDTPEEKKLIGYKADFSDVQVGDTVQVTISMLKSAAKPAKKDKKEDADADKPAKEDKSGAKSGKWIVTHQLPGKVTKITGATSKADPKMTIQVTTRVLGAGGTAQAQTFDAEKYKATLVVIGRRGSAGR